MRKRIKAIVSCFLSLVSVFSMFSILGIATDVGEEITYGILTEDYSIQFKKTNDGNLLVPVEQIQDISRLSSDNETMKRVLREKAMINGSNCDPWDLQINVLSISNSISKIEQPSIPSKYAVISDEKAVASLLQLSNFTSLISKKSQEPLDGGGVKIRVRYHWYWNSAPMFAHNDVVTLAWTSSFAAQTSVTKLVFTEYGRPYKYNIISGNYEPDLFDSREKEVTYTGSNAYVNYTTKVGIQNNFPIESSFGSDDGYFCDTYKTEGIYYVTVYKRNMPNPDPGYLTFTGNYYHHIGLNANNNDIFVMTQYGPDASSVPITYRAGATCQNNISY